MKILAISDLHGTLPDDFPEVDVVCICGDIVPLNIQRSKENCLNWLDCIFLPWVENLRCKKVVMIWGNHDFVGQSCPEWSMNQNLRHGKLVVLEDSEYTMNGVRFYGTPWCPDLYRWAYYGTGPELNEHFSHIPARVDVLLSHCPPRIADAGVVCQANAFNHGANYGSLELAEAIDKTEPRYVFCGHVHSGSHGEYEHNHTSIITNVSLKDEHYEPTYPYMVFDIVAYDH